MPVPAVFENLDLGSSIDQIMDQYDTRRLCGIAGFDVKPFPEGRERGFDLVQP